MQFCFCILHQKKCYLCFDVTCIKRNGVCVRYRIRKAVHPGLRERGEQIRSYERGSLWNVFIDPQQGMAEAIQWTKLEYSLHFHINSLFQFKHSENCECCRSLLKGRMTMNVEIFVLKCPKCNKCHESLGLLYSPNVFATCLCLYICLFYCLFCQSGLRPCQSVSHVSVYDHSLKVCSKCLCLCLLLFKIIFTGRTMDYKAPQNSWFNCIHIVLNKLAKLRRHTSHQTASAQYTLDGLIQTERGRCQRHLRV